MKSIILIALFFICEVLIAYSNSPEKDINSKAVTASREIELKKFFTGYNPDFETKGILRSSFKHELNPIYSK